MEKLELYIPKLEDLWFYQQMMSDPETMSYNANWDVDYEREPWVMDEGTVRITFDMNVRAAVGSFDIFDATLPALPVLEPGKLVMEVKFTEFCPQLVRDLVPPGAAELTAVSKYCLCYEKTAYLRGFNYWESDFENRGDI